MRLPQLLRRAGDSDAVFTARVAQVCQQATDHAAGILYQAFSKDAILKLFDSDFAVWADVRYLGAGFCGLFQTELVDPETGAYPFSAQWKQAHRNLLDRVKGQPRMIGEEKAGKNRTVTNRVTKRPKTSPFGDESSGGF